MNKKKVLLIEPDPDDQLLIIEAIEEIESAALYDVATNCKTALAELVNKENLPDIIFMAVKPSEMNEIECLKAIVSNTDLKNIPIVVVSSDERPVSVVKEIGAKAFLIKPSSFQLLRNQMEQLINLNFVTDSHIAAQTFQSRYGY